MANKVAVTIIYSNRNQIVWANIGENLLEVLRKQNFDIANYCGGNGTCGKCKVIVNGKIELACKYTISENITVEDITFSRDIESSHCVDSSYVLDGESAILAIDVGTTTLAVAMISSRTSTIAEVATRNNPQSKFGGDVISRIKFCMGGGLKELQKVLIESLNETILALLTKYNVKSLKKIVVSGNTTMLHIFLGIDCSSMGIAPYTPNFLAEKVVNSRELGFSFDSEIVTLPNISSFVGSDIVAGIVEAKMPQEGQLNVLIDLGTNAEIAVYNDKKCLVTAAAAGPCFEGANISQGMSAMLGAVNSYSLSNGKGDFTTIGEGKPIGICGTGLIDIISELYSNGIIDENGTFEEDDSFEIVDGVAVTQRDIREFQLAKSAVRSALEVLINLADCPYDKIQTVYLAGGFSSFINIDNAVKCGLIPIELGDKCISIANSSLSGTIKIATQNTNINQIISIAKYIDLTSHSDFSEKFMQYMSFDN